jgi:hypothetical protein
MPINIVCPGCRKTYLVKDEYAGKTSKCSCGARIEIPASAGPPAKAAVAAGDSRGPVVPSVAASPRLPRCFLGCC